MAIRWWMLACLLGGLLVLGGCGDDGDDGDTPPPAGTGGGNQAGTGGDRPNADAVISGVCAMQEDLSMCTGVDAFTQCALTTCMGQACADGVCKDYVTCIEGASDPCDDCTPAAACKTCIETGDQCAIKMCLSHLDC